VSLNSMSMVSQFSYHKTVGKSICLSATHCYSSSSQRHGHGFDSQRMHELKITQSMMQTIVSLFRSIQFLIWLNIECVHTHTHTHTHGLVCSETHLGQLWVMELHIWSSVSLCSVFIIHQCFWAKKHTHTHTERERERESVMGRVLHCLRFVNHSGNHSGINNKTNAHKHTQMCTNTQHNADRSW